MIYGTLVARALSHAWVTHKPTYAGLRLLLNSIKDDGQVIQDYVSRRVKNRTSWRYYGFQITKEVNPKKIEYRNCIVGSPLTVLAEAFILSEMSEETAFDTPDCAYSYLWPSNRESGRNYEYFYTGYQSRNEAVTSLLKQHSKSKALVFDIKRFYPSIDTSKLKSQLETRLKKIDASTRRDSIRQFVFSMLDLKSPHTAHGIPVGPDLSHALGHVAMTEVDRAMSSQFKNRYLRYVDDIIVVCDESEAKQARSILVSLLAEEGLELNQTKDDEVSAEEWIKYCPNQDMHHDRGNQLITFDHLKVRIALYLTNHPDQAVILQNVFHDEGFSIPIGRLRALTKAERNSLLFLLKKLVSEIWESLTRTDDSIKDLLNYAGAVRAHYLNHLERLGGVELEQVSMRRRWQIQQWRRLISQLMYLLPVSSYEMLLAKIPIADELAELRAVIHALVSGDCTSLLHIPGRAISTFTQIWQTTGGAVPKVHWDTIQPNRAMAGTASDLSLMLAMKVPASVPENLSTVLPGTSLMLDLCCSNPKPLVRSIHQSYLDELGLLFSGTKPDVLMQLFTTRYHVDEVEGLEAFGLDGGLSGSDAVSDDYC